MDHTKSGIDQELERKKKCVNKACGEQIPLKAMRCYQCHYDQPVDLYQGREFTLDKKSRGWRVTKHLLYDEDDLSLGSQYTERMIEVTDKSIQGVLQCIMSNQTCMMEEEKTLITSALSLILNLPKLKAFIAAPNNKKKVSSPLLKLMERMEEYRLKMMEELEALRTRGKIVYDGLWLLFEKGSKAAFQLHGETLAGFVRSANYTPGFFSRFTVSTVHVKSDGVGFFYQEQTHNMHRFDGIIDIRDLDLFPLTPELEATLTERGRKYQELALGKNYMSHEGFMVGTTSWSNYISSWRADGRVMVDIETYNRFNPGTTYVQKVQHTGENTDTFNSLAPSQLFMTWHTVPGFSFIRKSWGEFLLKNLEPVVFSDDAFDKLVLPRKKKVLLKALVEEHTKGNKNAKREKKKTDLIDGKGGGCIFLLHGTPGTGKTLTAEAVSEQLHLPLYSISVGELGTTPQALEDSLKKSLELAAIWKASILLDEADIFLERRSKEDIVRNAMVGIFLRLLEYHNGILFLTTNRISCIDAAFSSRISIALKYEELCASARKRIWKNFLSSLLTAEQMKSVNFRRLSSFPLNGRQIRSCVTLADTLAQSKEEALGMQHLLITTAVTMSFCNDLTSEQGIPHGFERPAPSTVDWCHDNPLDGGYGYGSDDDEDNCGTKKEKEKEKEKRKGKGGRKGRKGRNETEFAGLDIPLEEEKEDQTAAAFEGVMQDFVRISKDN